MYFVQKSFASELHNQHKLKFHFQNYSHLKVHNHFLHALDLLAYSLLHLMYLHLQVQNMYSVYMHEHLYKDHLLKNLKLQINHNYQLYLKLYTFLFQLLFHMSLKKHHHPDLLNSYNKRKKNMGSSSLTVSSSGSKKITGQDLLNQFNAGKEVVKQAHQQEH